jgi:hypothetical protein
MTRKLSILVVATAGIVATAIWSGLPRQQPLTISFCGFTDVYQFDRPVATFIATNRNSRPLRYATHLECKTGGSWPVYIGPLPHNDSPWMTVPAGKEFTIRKLPPTSGEPWRISVLYTMEDTFLGKARWRFAEFFYSLNLDKIGRLIHEGAKGYITVGPEIAHDAGPR